MQLFVKILIAVTPGLLFEFLTDGLISGRSRKYPIKEDLHVQPAATDNDRDMMTRVNDADGLQGKGIEPGDIEFLPDRDTTHQMMHDGFEHHRGGLAGHDAQFLVDLHGIAGNDLAVNTFCQRTSDFGLADGGGTDDENDFLEVHDK